MEIKFASEIGKKGSHKYIWSACELCGKKRWVKLVGGTPVAKICKKCSLNIGRTTRKCPIPKEDFNTSTNIEGCLTCKRRRCVYDKGNGKILPL